MQNKKSILYNPFFVSFLIIAIGTAIFFYVQNKNEKETVEEGLSKDVVAVVNGDSIYRDKFEQQLNLAGKEMSEEKLLNQMIQNQLILQDAASKGVSVTQKEINSQYDQIVAQFESQEKFQQFLEKNNSSKDGLKKSLKQQITFQKYSNSIKQENNITTTEEEVKTYYEENKDSLTQKGQETPSLEKVKSQIEQFVIQEKLNSIIGERIQKLYNNATIEKNL